MRKDGTDLGVRQENGSETTGRGSKGSVATGPCPLLPRTRECSPADERVRARDPMQMLTVLQVTLARTLLTRQTDQGSNRERIDESRSLNLIPTVRTRSTSAAQRSVLDASMLIECAERRQSRADASRSDWHLSSRLCQKSLRGWKTRTPQFGGLWKNLWSSSSVFLTSKSFNSILSSRSPIILLGTRGERISIQ